MWQFRATYILWALGLIFSAISIHSFFFNRASSPFSNVTTSVVASLEEGHGQKSNSNTFETVTVENSTSTSIKLESNLQEDLLSKSESVEQSQIAAVENTFSTTTSVACRHASDAMGVAEEAAYPPVYSQFNCLDELNNEVTTVEQNEADTASRLFASPRPPVRPTRPEYNLGKTHEIAITRESAPPLVTLRPAARPSSLTTDMDTISQPKLEPDPVEVAISEVLRSQQAEHLVTILPDAEEPNRAVELKSLRLGTVLGLFEANARSWALVESLSGTIFVLEPGDMIGAGVVSSISNGSMLISNEGSVRAYNIGDRL